MNTLVPVRFKIAWSGYRVGDIITPNGTFRDWLIGRGFAERIERAPMDTSASESPVPKRQRKVKTTDGTER